jgi:PAS domain S-box-containing protein
MTFHFTPDSGLRQQLPSPQSDAGSRSQAHRLLRLLPLLLPVGLMAWRHGGRLRQALNQSACALHDAEERFHTLLNQAPVGICQTSLSGCFLLANHQYCSLLGREMDTLRTMRMHDLTHLEDRDRHRAGQARMLATGEPFVIEKRLVRPDESDVWVISHMSVTHDAQGRPQHIIAAVQDISHRRAAEAALHAMNATLEQRVADAVAERARVEESLRQSQRMEALGQLAGGVAHDFNNVLQAIAGGARLIQRRPDNPDSVRRLAGLVVDAADRGASVTRRLLSFARRGSLQPGPVDASPLLEDLREMLARTLGSGITVQASAEAELPPMMADKGGLETVLVNLATNARDAMLDEAGLLGAGPNRVSLRAFRDDDAPGLPPGCYIRLEVADTGSGMDGDTLAHAAEPFFTTKPRGRGTGLGLSVARGFAEQSGGLLTIRSVPGEGTTVRIWLPAIVAAAAPARPDTRPVVVLVDDDAEVRDVLADTLASQGCRVSGYADAASALARIADDAPDLLISDLSMPGTDGMTLIRQARLLRPGLAAILLTGHSGPELETAVAKLAGGPVILVQKPVQSAALAAQISALLPSGVRLNA